MPYWSGQILGITLQGKGALEYPDHSQPVERGQIYLIHLHRHDYVLRNLGADTWAVVWMYFRPGAIPITLKD